MGGHRVKITFCDGAEPQFSNYVQGYDYYWLAAPTTSKALIAAFGNAFATTAEQLENRLRLHVLDRALDGQVGSIEREIRQSLNGVERGFTVTGFSSETPNPALWLGQLFASDVNSYYHTETAWRLRRPQ